MTPTTVGVIGLGTMGRTIAHALRVVPSLTVLGFDRQPAQADIEPASTIDELAQRSDVMIIAVKPQQFSELAQALGPVLKDQLIVSIMAGVSLHQLRVALGVRRIVRAMPNLAAIVGESVTGWYADPTIAAADRQLVTTILSAVGHELELNSEAAIDALTAVTGSGTGYLMAFAEALQAAAEEVGFEPTLAAELVRQTLIGGGKLLAEDARSFGQLKAAVTSKGGTTEAALAAMPEAELAALLQRAVAAAHARARILGVQR